MGEKSGKEKEKEGEKITAILTRWEFKRVFEFFVGYHNIYIPYDEVPTDLFQKRMKPWEPNKYWKLSIILMLINCSHSESKLVKTKKPIK